jgi:hypothetical protein
MTVVVYDVVHHVTQRSTHLVIATSMSAQPRIFTVDELDEFCLWWWGSDNDERTVTDVIESGSMTAFAEACIARWGK